MLTFQIIFFNYTFWGPLFANFGAPFNWRPGANSPVCPPPPLWAALSHSPASFNVVLPNPGTIAQLKMIVVLRALLRGEALKQVQVEKLLGLRKKRYLASLLKQKCMVFLGFPPMQLDRHMHKLRTFLYCAHKSTHRTSQTIILCFYFIKFTVSLGLRACNLDPNVFKNQVEPARRLLFLLSILWKGT